MWEMASLVLPAFERTWLIIGAEYSPLWTAIYAGVPAANTGFAEGYLWRVLKAYQLAMPVAFCCVLFVRPLVMLLVRLTVRSGT